MSLNLQSASMNGVSAHEPSLDFFTTFTLIFNTCDTSPDLLCSLAILCGSYLSVPAPFSTADASFSDALSFDDGMCASSAGTPPASPAGAPPASPAGALPASCARAPPATHASALQPAANAAGSVPDSSKKAKQRRSNSHKRGSCLRKRRRRDA